MSLNQPGLYVHIPFCLSRCGYCAFVSSLYSSELADAYLTILDREMRFRHDVFASSQPSTLFIGGGTPSCLSSSQLQTLLAMLPFPKEGGEATCELNPDSVDQNKLELLRKYGVNRCSFGVQTFSEQGLRLLGRRHDAATAIGRIGEAKKIGFSSLSLDLINGWPGQTPEEWKEDLRKTVDLGVQHISCYTLILEEGSKSFAALSALTLEDDSGERARDFWEMTHDILAAAGFVQYETSNFALPGYACQHNVHTWQGKEYLGVGVAAHSYLGGRRFANTDLVDAYLACNFITNACEIYSERLEPEARAKECAVFWLRLFEGIDAVEFKERTGFDFFALYRNELPGLLQQGILECDKNKTRIRISERYQPILDSVLVDLV